MFRIPEDPTRQQVLTFISDSASYGNLGTFIGAGFSKAVLNDNIIEIALSWGELLEKASEKLDVDYNVIWKIGVGYPEIASSICKAHSEKSGCDYTQSLSVLKREIAALTMLVSGQRKKREIFKVSRNFITDMGHYNKLRHGDRKPINR